MEDQTATPINLDSDSSTIIVNSTETASGTSVSATTLTDDRPGGSGVHLLLMCLDTERHVTFHEDVINNEGMNRRKSKCCCIYRKPHVFGESSSSSDDECEHCCGHPEVRLSNRLKKQQQQAKLSQCSCHSCGHSQRQSTSVTSTNSNTNCVPTEPVEPTEIAGDSGNLKGKTESLSLVSTASTQTLKP